MALHTRDQLLHLVPDLAARSTEATWLEFKVDNSDPEMIGKDLAALSNAAALAGEAFGYLVWGVEDGTHRIVGTAFDPVKKRVGNQELEAWLRVSIQPGVYFEFTAVEIGAYRLVVLAVTPALSEPIKFKGAEYIRSGSNTVPLARNPDLARQLWRVFDRDSFELRTALPDVSEDDVLRLLDYPAYFYLLHRPLPDNRRGIIDALAQDNLIEALPGSGYRITNLGAILLAKRLGEFPTLERKPLRVIRYKGRNKMEVEREQVGARGYASGFEGLVDFVNGLLPTNEIVGQALRETRPMYPELAVRELVANALIHQDFSVRGTGPVISIFDDRFEVQNPGRPLVEIARLIDAAPKSRNEKLASLMRRMGICEEQGSGWDKVAFQIEFYQLPAPLVETGDDYMRVTMYSHKELNKMDSEDRTRAVYLHACLRQSQGDATTNRTIRERFGIEEKNKARASRLLAEAVTAGAITPYDASAPTKLMRYVPFWAAESRKLGFVDG
jgi:predicted HTH transcriptional regulator